MKTISFCNQKGGVGKTTSAAEIAGLLAVRGNRVLAVDMDPQGNLSDVFGANLEGRYSVYELLRGDASFQDVLLTCGNVDLLPAEITLAMLEPELAGVALGREQRLREYLSKHSNEYDFCIIDCPPSLGLLVTMALTASDYVVIPTTASLFASKGIAQLASTIQMVQTYSNSSLKIAGVLFGKHHAEQRNARMIREVAEIMAANLGTMLFETCIREAVEVEDAHNAAQTICARNPKANPAVDYEAFCAELLERLGD